eukprot:6429620-Prymnesium_polylepis.2
MRAVTPTTERTTHNQSTARHRTRRLTGRLPAHNGGLTRRTRRASEAAAEMSRQRLLTTL